MLATAKTAAARTLFNPAFARDVVKGLTRKRQKTLPAAWFYDDVGSALFEAITLLPEYGLTRADARLLACGAAEMVRTAGHPELLIELGSGSGVKTRHLLTAAARAGEVRYIPIDVSRSALEGCAKALGGVERVSVEPVEATYLDGIRRALRRRKPGGRAMVLFLGSTIGNFSATGAARFLARIQTLLRAGDSFLLGADLVKARARLLAAYDDPVGVTAAFNLNLLARINRELGGEFDLARFAHEARYDERHARVEMHLRSRVAQQVYIAEPGLTVSFSAGETIWTESSHKFRAEDLAAMGERAGWECARQWVDREWGFAETLFVKP